MRSPANTEEERPRPAASGVSALCNAVANLQPVEGAGEVIAPPADPVAAAAAAEQPRRERERQRSRSPSRRDLKNEVKQLNELLRQTEEERDDARQDYSRVRRVANDFERERDQTKGELQAVTEQRNELQGQLNARVAQVAVLQHEAARRIQPPQAFYPHQGRGQGRGGRGGGRDHAPQQQQRAAQVADLVLGALTNQSPQQQRPRRQQGYQQAQQGYQQGGDAVFRDVNGNAV